MIHVESVRFFEEECDVYDIDVDVDHSFIVAGVVVHNSAICAAHDGKRWPVGDDAIRTPPLHYRCRSVLTPVIDWEGLGMEPPPDGTRASAGGQVPSSTTYQSWLQSQPAAVQDEVLGPGRGRLFRRGGVTLDEMVRTDGRMVRIAELEG